MPAGGRKMNTIHACEGAGGCQFKSGLARVCLPAPRAAVLSNRAGMCFAELVVLCRKHFL
jgi:hypothetical protein